MNKQRQYLPPRLLGLFLLLSCFLGVKAQVLEYWFDNNFSNRATIPISVGLESMQILEFDFTDIVKFPLGFHRLNYRVVANGEYSPVYSDCVMRLPEGEKTEITYWLDDEYEKQNGRSVLKGFGKDKTTAIVRGMLDFSKASKGMHRLHYRITTNGYDDGVVYEAPVLITELYNNTAATVVSESKWMDEATPASLSISNPQDMVTRNYTLNANNYSEGQHVFHVQYQNSAGVWGEPNATYFYKDASGRLKAGLLPDDTDGIYDTERDKVLFSCDQGTIYIDCLSPQLSTTGIVTVYDMMGKVIAKQVVNNENGIHAEIDVQAYSKQLLIVRMNSGSMLYTKKVVVK